MNKVRVITLALLLTAVATFGQQDEQGTIINGIEWATKNVADSGNFTAKPDMCGYYYQWNRAVGATIGGTRPAAVITDYEFKANPCPQDWRLPTWGEVHSLRDMYTRGTWAPANSKGNSVAGRFMGPNHANATIKNPGAAVFMPACGIFWSGNNVTEPEDGYYYYHTVADGARGGSWWFNSLANGGANFQKYCAFQLRCIRAEWLTIDGIEWAKSNLATPGVLAAKPDMKTEFYQWGRNEAQPATGSVTVWSNIPDTATVWRDNPCPENWRLPTYAEFQALTDEGYYWALAGDMGNEVDGVFLGRNAGTCALPDNMVGCVFLPANGARRNNNGLHVYENMSAFYWSSEQANANNGRGLRADEMGGASAVSPHKAYGYNIRCVHDVSITLGDTSSSSTSSASILSITQASYSRAMTNYSRVPVDTIVDDVPSVHIENSNETHRVNLYPNPVISGQLTIDNGELAIGMVEVRSIYGEVLRTQDFGSQTTGTLQLYGLQGTYFIRIGANMYSIVVKH